MRRAFFVLLTLTACGSQNSNSATTPVVQAVQATPPEAEEHAIADNPTFPKVSKESQEKAKELVENGRALLKEGGKLRASDAAALYSEAITTDPRNPQAYWELGWAQQINGDFDSAIATWGTLKTLDPKFADIDAFTAIATTRRGEKPPEPPPVIKKSKAHHRTDMKTDLAR